MTRRTGRQVGLGVASLAATLAFVERDGVSEAEVRAFRWVNDRPDCWRGPAWLVMQAGSLGAAVLAASAAGVGGHRVLARRLLLAGTGTWAASKVVKWTVRRPRPALLLSGVHVRGQPASGLGYLSGHAGVVTALVAAALPELHGRGRAMVLVAAPLVGMTRMYVGAHLPLDVLGGVALGLTVEGLIGVLDAPGPDPAVSRR